MLMTKLTWPYIFIVQIMQNDEVVLKGRELLKEALRTFWNIFYLDLHLL